MLNSCLVLVTTPSSSMLFAWDFTFSLTVDRRTGLNFLSLLFVLLMPYFLDDSSSTHLDFGALGAYCRDYLDFGKLRILPYVNTSPVVMVTHDSDLKSAGITVIQAGIEKCFKNDYHGKNAQ